MGPAITPAFSAFAQPKTKATTTIAKLSITDAALGRLREYAEHDMATRKYEVDTAKGSVIVPYVGSSGRVEPHNLTGACRQAVRGSAQRNNLFKSRRLRQPDGYLPSGGSRRRTLK
ncbi:MAG: hypothetical protein ACXWKG_19225 [Limisphaerales bacterium]